MLTISAVVDLAQLLARDHDQLDRATAFLLEPHASSQDRQSALAALRVSFAAHADAEATVLHGALAHVAAKQDVAGLIAQVLAAHRIQESILRRMDVNARSDDWAAATIRLRRTLKTHSEHEQDTMMRVLRECVPTFEYQRLAGTYTIEKVHALGSLSQVASFNRRPTTRATRRAAR